MVNDYAYLELEIRKYFDGIKNRVLELYRQAIQETIYNAYHPTYYSDGFGNRTNQMLDNIAIKMEGGRLIVYTDTSKMHYYSAVDGRDVTELVPWMLQNTGHMDSTGIVNMYHYYPERNFLGRAEELIRGEFPQLNIEIILDEPNVV